MYQHQQAGPRTAHACVQEQEPRLPTLLKLLLWAQSQLDSKLQYPRMVDLVAGRLSDPSDVNQMC